MTHTTALVLRAEKRPAHGSDPSGPNRLYRNPRLDIERRELGPLEKGHVRVEMIFAGICGTDVNATRCNPNTGYILGSAPLQIGLEGRVPGHEGVGRVIEAGAGNHRLSPGDYVAFSSIITCFRCSACRRGDFNQCEHAVLLGMEKDGLFATVVDVPQQLAYNVNAIADMESGLQAAACIEPAGCGFLAATSAGIAPGERVLIFGAGPIGIFTAMLCREVFGAATVSIVEPIAFRRDLASRWADHAYAVEEFFSLQNRPSFDVMIEASGAVENIDRAFQAMSANSRVVLLARSSSALALQHVDHMITNNIAILGSRGHLCGAFDSLLALYAAGRLPLHEVVTGTVEGLAGIKACLENPDDVQNNHCKVLARLSGGTLV